MLIVTETMAVTESKDPPAPVASVHPLSVALTDRLKLGVTSKFRAAFVKTLNCPLAESILNADPAFPDTMAYVRRSGTGEALSSGSVPPSTAPRGVPAFAFSSIDLDCALRFGASFTLMIVTVTVQVVDSGAEALSVAVTFR